MKKLFLTFAVLAMGTSAVSAQDREIDLESLNDFNKIELSHEGARVETDLKIAFPMYFGTSVLSNVSYKGDWALADQTNFLNTRTAKNFVYGLELASMHVHYGALDMSLGLRWTFMDFTFSDPKVSMKRVGNSYVPYLISLENPGYDFNKSKIHASYFGIPLRVGFNIGRATVYAGASAELLTNGYTKYKRPKTRTQAKDLFNPFRATVEGGFSWGNLGVFVMYGLTPLFPDSLSDARTVTFGLTLGI